MILMIDNYDSFTHNLYQYLSVLGEEVIVKRNDEITIDEIRKLSPLMIVLSPGPGTPADSGVCIDVIKELGSSMPLLGICLGHQAIAEVFGASVIRAGEPVHGKVHEITNNGSGMFKGLPNNFGVTRYHSLVIDEETLPPEFEITARTKCGLIMGIRHRTLLIEGLQYHPEAILTEYGSEVLGNFLESAKEFWNDKVQTT